MARRNREFWESAYVNKATYRYYYNRLIELSTSMFEWVNVPDTIDTRFLELTLFTEGQAVFFKDEAIGYLALQNACISDLNVYRIPNKRRAYACNGYSKTLDEKDSVIIYNNYLHTNSKVDVQMFARRLYELDRTIDVNAKAQKTPIIILCDESERLTMKNLYMKYEGNEPFIMGDRNLKPDSVKVLTTGAPYVCDKLYELKTQIWNEALTYLGISNINTSKKERLITDEVMRNQGGTIASRYSRLQSRKDACEKINEMFGLNMDCRYRDDYQLPEESEDVEMNE